MAQILFEDTPEFLIEPKTSKGVMASMHYHHAYELYYLLRGERDYFIGDKFYKVSPGDLVFIPRSMLHRTAGRSGARFLIYFKDSFLERFFTRETLGVLSLDTPYVFRPAEGGSLEPLFRAAYATAEAPDAPSRDARLAGYLFRILFEAATAPNAYVEEAYSDGRIGEIVRYINEHYGELDGIDALAEHFFLSKYYFCRLFSKNLGVSAVTYLNTIKIRAASALLKESDKTMTEIATHCGFNSASYFCKVFKSEKGVSPSEYRRRYATYRKAPRAVSGTS